MCPCDGPEDGCRWWIDEWIRWIPRFKQLDVLLSFEWRIFFFHIYSSSGCSVTNTTWFSSHPSWELSRLASQTENMTSVLSYHRSLLLSVRHNSDLTFFFKRALFFRLPCSFWPWQSIFLLSSTSPHGGEKRWISASSPINSLLG